MLYVDFRKAFDSIHRCMILKILKAYDVPPRLLAAINKLYENTRARVITPDGETKFIQIIAGVLQGDTLSPYLFVIVLDYVIRKNIPSKRGITWISLTKMTQSTRSRTSRPTLQCKENTNSSIQPWYTDNCKLKGWNNIKNHWKL